MRCAPAAAAALLAPLPAAAQDPQAWLTSAVTVELGDGWKAGGEASARSRANEREPQLLVRVHAGREVSRSLTLWIGYVRTRTFTADDADAFEQRFTGQADGKLGTLGPFDLSTRTRIEARSFRDAMGTSWRARQLLQLDLPVGGDVTVGAGVEPFVALNRTDNARRTFEQLRFNLNMVVPLSDAVWLDAGYRHQILYRPGEQVVNHVVPVTLRVSL